MIRRLVITYLAVTAFALTLFAIPLGITFAHHERDKLLSEIEADADAMAAGASSPIARQQPVPRAGIMQYAKRTGGHVVVVDGRGVALVDTEHPNGPATNYSNRPEVASALQGARVEGSRRSDTAGTTLLYAAVPTSENGRVNGAVRITYPTATLDGRVHRAWAQLALLSLGVLAAVAVIAYFLARSMARPLRRLDVATDQLARGDLRARVETDASWPELRHLAESFNRMADRLALLLAAQQRFVTDASHQLRTPLTALRLRIENLEADVPERDQLALQAAAAEVTRMSRLVNGLLVLARDEGSAHDVVAVDVAEIARERTDIWQTVAGERDVTVALTTPPVAWAKAVVGSVEQILDNLVDNAYAVSPDRSTISIRVAAVRGTSRYTFSTRVLAWTPTRAPAPSIASGARPTRRPAAPVSGSRSCDNSPKRPAARRDWMLGPAAESTPW